VAASCTNFDPNAILYTDGSKSVEGTGCAVFHRENLELTMKLGEPSGVFTAELTAIVLALYHIKSHDPGQFLIVTDSMSSILALESRKISLKTHPLVLKSREALWWLENNGYTVTLTWAPAHVGVTGNERADRLAKDAIGSGNDPIFPPFNCDSIPIVKSNLLHSWQSRWNQSEKGRYTYSVIPKVCLEPWFKKFAADRHTICLINRMMSNHTCTKVHLNRINVINEKICQCGDDYETLDHILWGCARYANERNQMLTDLSVVGALPDTPIRDMLGCKHWRGLLVICSFLKRCNQKKFASFSEKNCIFLHFHQSKP
jgi:ribonuclease HI